MLSLEEDVKAQALRNDPATRLCRPNASPEPAPQLVVSAAPGPHKPARPPADTHRVCGVSITIHKDAGLCMSDTEPLNGAAMRMSQPYVANTPHPLPLHRTGDAPEAGCVG